MADLLAEGNAVLDTFFSKLPEGVRDTVKAAVTAAPDAVKAIGEMAMSRSDYSRSKDQLAQEQAANGKFRGDLQTWYDANKANLDLGVKAKELGWDPTKALTDDAHRDGAGPRSTDLPADVVRKDDLVKFVNEREAGAAAFFGLLNDLSFDHFQQFGERLDTTALMRDPRIEKLGLDGVYKAQHGARIEQRQKDLREKDFDAEVNKRLAARLASSRPVDATAAGSDFSPLDALEPQTATGKPGLVEDAVAEYHRLAALHTT